MNEIPPADPSPSVAIVGCGAIGGVLGAELARARHSFSICTTNADVRSVWATTGPYLAERLVSYPLAAHRILTDPSEAQHPLDLVFVAVPPAQMDSVASSLKSVLSPRGRVVCLSNGWCEPRLAHVLGEDRVLGAVVTWGAKMPQPGHYVRTSEGGFVLGSLSGTWPASTERIIHLLSTVGPVSRTNNLKGARMSKLVINCAVSGLGTVGGAELGELLVKSHIRHIGIQLMAEAITVARADGTTLQNVAGIDWERWTIGRRRLGVRLYQHALLMAVGLRYRHLRSSILASIERGRPPAIDYINGEVSALGQRLGIATPYNDAVVDTVWKIARGEIVPGHLALRHVAELGEARSPSL